LRHRKMRNSSTTMTEAICLEVPLRESRRQWHTQRSDRIHDNLTEGHMMVRRVAQQQIRNSLATIRLRCCFMRKSISSVRPPLAMQAEEAAPFDADSLLALLHRMCDRDAVCAVITMYVAALPVTEKRSIPSENMTSLRSWRRCTLQCHLASSGTSYQTHRRCGRCPGRCPGGCGMCPGLCPGVPVPLVGVLVSQCPFPKKKKPKIALKYLQNNLK